MKSPTFITISLCLWTSLSTLHEGLIMLGVLGLLSFVCLSLFLCSTNLVANGVFRISERGHPTKLVQIIYRWSAFCKTLQCSEVLQSFAFGPQRILWPPKPMICADCAPTPVPYVDERRLIPGCARWVWWSWRSLATSPARPSPRSRWPCWSLVPELQCTRQPRRRSPARTATTPITTRQS